MKTILIKVVENKNGSDTSIQTENICEYEILGLLEKAKIMIKAKIKERLKKSKK